MSLGKLTSEAGRTLSDMLQHQGYDVLFDHGGKINEGRYKVGKINGWYGNEYNASSQLAQLDIAVVEKESHRALALIEIEESPSVPKVIIGDIFATLLCDHIAFERQRELEVGEFTGLLVLIRAGKIRKHSRDKYIQNQAIHLMKYMQSGNAVIGRVVLLEFESEKELSEILNKKIEEWILNK